MAVLQDSDEIISLEEAKMEGWTIDNSGTFFFDIESGLNDIDYYENDSFQSQSRDRSVRIPKESIVEDKAIVGVFYVTCYSAGEAAFVANALEVRLDGPVEGTQYWMFEAE
jgi:hypothetical protein